VEAGITPSAEANNVMDEKSQSTSSFPFVSADADIDMIDKVQPSTNGGSVSDGASALGPLDLARQLSTTIQNLIAQTEQETAQRQAVEARLQVADSQLQALQEVARTGEALKQTLREAGQTSLTADDLQKLQNVLQALSRDPNHIMVLAAVAQQSGKLLEVVNAFSRLYPLLK
jgi:multidrug efflux pump subunit AcrA (membrane-fusion protein)